MSSKHRLWDKLIAGCQTGRIWSVPAGSVIAMTAQGGRRAGTSGRSSRRREPAPLPQRDRIVDYGLHRRAQLEGLRTGRVSLVEACDAHPHLRLAAQHYGEPAPTACPVCGKDELRLVHFVYGDALGTASGQAKSAAELRRMHTTIREFVVYVVEICPGCKWNHLNRSFVLGHGGLSSAADG
jgi:hypothetical protein